MGRTDHATCQGDTPSILEWRFVSVQTFAVSNAVSNHKHNTNQNQINH
jgi:hypothetical protein